MFEPSKSNYRKAFKGRIGGIASRGSSVVFGDYGLKACECERITSKQLEAARRVIARFLKKRGRVWIRIFPNVPVSRKPADVRMGKGKGSTDFWVFKVQPGRILFEVAGVDFASASHMLIEAAAKLPIKCRVVPV